MKPKLLIGSTLIELLVVLSIIALLSSIILPNVRTSRDKAVNSRKVLMADEYKKALELYYDDNGNYPVLLHNHKGCLGIGNPNGDCFNIPGASFNPPTENESISPSSSGLTLNGVLNSYISGPPPNIDSVMINGVDYRGIGYLCLTGVTDGPCQSYAIFWVMRSVDTKCGGGFSDDTGKTLYEDSSGAGIFTNNTFCVYTNNKAAYDARFP
jgi:type II secretory pathway pseudopilin PulG